MQNLLPMLAWTCGCTSPTRYVGNCITKEKQLPYQLEYQKNTCLVPRTTCCFMIMIALLPCFTSFRKGLANHLRVIQHKFPSNSQRPFEIPLEISFSRGDVRTPMETCAASSWTGFAGWLLWFALEVCGCLWKQTCPWSPFFLAGRFRWRS